MRPLLSAALSVVFLFPALSFADGIHGKCTNRSGEKCMEKNHTISTSWNSKKGYPDSSGNYSIQFDGSVGTTITVYCDGQTVGEVHVKGDKRYDVVCK